MIGMKYCPKCESEEIELLDEDSGMWVCKDCGHMAKEFPEKGGNHDDGEDDFDEYDESGEEEFDEEDYEEKPKSKKTKKNAKKTKTKKGGKK